MDRIAPTHRPAGKASGYQHWRDLLFLHWPIEVSELRSVVPRELDIDTYEGRAYVGVVAFAIYGARPSWVPEFAGFDFLETNVRTYVHVSGTHPGVYFFSLDAASWLAVKAARLTFGLPYFHARMRLDKHVEGERAGTVTYETTRLSGRRPRLCVRYRVGDELGPSPPDTLEHFLLERYLLHVERRGAIHTGQIHHQAYPVWTAEVHECHDELVAAAGLQPAADAPMLVHYAPGVDVEIFPLRRLRRGDRNLTANPLQT